jgi:hypothetical protein
MMDKITSINPYLKRFLNSFASENVIGIFSRYRNAHKEITESWAMLEAAKKHVENLNDSLVVVVGDGCSPRTGVIFAYFTKADVISIDPLFNLNHWYDHCDKQTKMGFEPQRITVFAMKAEDCSVDCNGKDCVVIWPHSHAPMNNTKIFNYKSRTDISMPCCVAIPKNWASTPHTTYDDYNVLSPKKTVHIWKEAVNG